MASDVIIEIFGQIDTLDGLLAVAAAAAEEALIDWTTPINEVEAAEAMIDAANWSASPFRLTRSDTHNHFDAVSAACRAHGVAYARYSGSTGSDGYDEAVAWKPGMEREGVFATDGAQPVIPLEAIAKAASEGIDAVRALVKKHQAASISEVERTLSVADDVVEAYEARRAKTRSAPRF
jgi:hypothetical protein